MAVHWCYEYELYSVSNFKVNVTFNLTDRQLDKTTETIPTNGLDYAVTPNKVPVEDIIIQVEATVRCVPPDQTEQIRQEALAQNITETQSKASKKPTERQQYSGPSRR